MPTYEYVCRSCGRQFEVVQSFSDAPLTICDECGGELRKMFTAPAISFKGSGFYATDHRRKAHKAGATPESTSDRSAETTSESGTSAAKSEPGSTGAKSEPGSTGAKSEPASSENTSRTGGEGDGRPKESTGS